MALKPAVPTQKCYSRLGEARAINASTPDSSLPIAHLSRSYLRQTEAQCLQDIIRCLALESDSCPLKHILRSTLHYCPFLNEQDLSINIYTRRLAPSGTICHDSGLPLVHFENLIEERCGLLLLYHLAGPARTEFTLHNSSALRDTVDQV